MNNNIKPAWMFLGVFLVTLLWALESDNRPRVRLAMPYSSDDLRSSTIDVASPQSRQADNLKPDEQLASEDRSVRFGKTEKKNNLQPHRDSLLSDASRDLLVNSANRQLPAQEQAFYLPDKEPVEPFRDNNPLHAADRLYSCFGNSCLNIVADQ
ncbi:hypothetical protein [Endozoicomonas elysicola]|uniref:Uncharacterized protein n=1 Tax=Endozoicomonas elysicola TaxID=305900 RepID=A0A081KAK2_9GAMM|nr:hypothetical protein [Endozoicomonas elysicola]KEI71178.1 hypothetical protein GV64_10870 [Endozoicomonas elysicola]